ncbi:hypothetical protein [Candidatus Carsonella ruddii]|uniref:hypothetical protein n=1 Tax=Carsonella ruddii TaxID=114186 RepID=UPI003D9AAF13
MNNENLLSLNFYLFKDNKFYNKLIYNKLKKIKIIEDYNIINYYNNLKKTLNYYNPFYGIKLNSYCNRIKNNLIKKKIFEFEKEVFLYRNFTTYKIPYKELSYIFNMSIEKIRIKKK